MTTTQTHFQPEDLKLDDAEPVASKVGCAYGYIRVTARTEPDDQRRRILEIFQEVYAPQGFTWGRFFEELGRSALGTPFASRPAGKELLQALVPGDVLIAARDDRLFADRTDVVPVLDMMWKRRVVLHVGNQPMLSALDPDTHDVIMFVLGRVEWMYSTLGSARIKERNQIYREQGREKPRNGGIPYGQRYLPGGGLVVNYFECAILAEGVRLRALGLKHEEIVFAVEEELLLRDGKSIPNTVRYRSPAHKFSIVLGRRFTAHVWRAFFRRYNEDEDLRQIVDARANPEMFAVTRYSKRPRDRHAAR